MDHRDPFVATAVRRRVEIRALIAGEALDRGSDLALPTLKFLDRLGRNMLHNGCGGPCDTDFHCNLLDLDGAAYRAATTLRFVLDFLLGLPPSDFRSNGARPLASAATCCFW